MSTTFKGPVVSTNGFTGDVTATTVAATTSATVGSGTAITKILKLTCSGVVATTAAGALADISLTAAGATAGDTVIATPLDAAVETNIEILGAWVSATNTVKVRIRNNHGSSALTGSTTNWQVCLIRS